MVTGLPRTSSPDVVDSVMADFVLASSWADEVQELSKESVDWCAVSDGLNVGD
jgi:3-methyladenine DNA glycosylase AlkD